MYNWSVDVSELKKDTEKYTIWKLEQLINYGLGGERISEEELRTYWDRLRLDSAKKSFLSFLLWGRKSLQKRFH